MVSTLTGNTLSLPPADDFLRFSGVPNAKRGEKIRSGYLSPAFSGAQNTAESLRSPCILRGHQRQARRENQKWLPHPCVLRVPKEGGPMSTHAGLDPDVLDVTPTHMLESE